MVVGEHRNVPLRDLSALARPALEDTVVSVAVSPHAATLAIRRCPRLTTIFLPEARGIAPLLTLGGVHLHRHAIPVVCRVGAAAAARGPSSAIVPVPALTGIDAAAPVCAPREIGVTGVVVAGVLFIPTAPTPLQPLAAACRVLSIECCVAAVVGRRECGTAGNVVRDARATDQQISAAVPLRNPER